MKTVGLILFWLLMVLGLAAQNQMPLTNTLANYIPNSYFGYQMATLDFNNDGFDDLFVMSFDDVAHHITTVRAYFGGVLMDTIPDFVYTIPYDFPDNGEKILNAGDVNGDGYEDFMIREDVEGGHTQSRLKFFYGGTNPDMEPDQIVLYQNADDTENGVEPIECIGDVNHDGCDDLGLMTRSASAVRNLSIMLGGTFNTITVIDSISEARMCLVTRAGDMNGDGIDDFFVGYVPKLYPLPEFPRCQYLYYGSNPLNLANRVLMLESYVTNQVETNGYGIGDFNGDGFDDYLYYLCPPSNEGSLRFKLGSSSLPISQEFDLSGWNYIFLNTKCTAYGDFNGDGFSDLAAGDYAAITWQGIGAIWLGKATPNGLQDLVINHPATAPYHQFGWAVETGDFNGDGYCDAVYSAPNSQASQPHYPGYVYIFSGNALLADTTVANDDDVLVPGLQFKLTLYPNPVDSKELALHFKLEGVRKDEISKPVLCLYNIKGQLITRHTVTKDEINNGTGLVYKGKLKHGVYIAALNDNDKRITTAKVTVR